MNRRLIKCRKQGHEKKRREKGKSLNSVQEKTFKHFYFKEKEHAVLKFVNEITHAKFYFHKKICFLGYL